MTDFTGYSIDDYTQSLYTYDTSAEATKTTMNDIENTVDNVVDTVSDWVSKNIVDPIQEAMNQPVQVPEYTSISDLIAENTPGMTKEEVENGLNNMGDTSKNGVVENSITADEPDENLAWAAENGITAVDYSATETEPLTATDVWNAAVQLDSDTYSAPKNGIANTVDAGVAKTIEGVEKSINFSAIATTPLAEATGLAESTVAKTLSFTRAASKLTGVFNVASTSYDIYNDCQNYQGMDLALAVGLDVVAYGIGITVAAGFLTLSVPAVGAIVGGTLLASAVGIGTQYCKDSFLTKTTN